MMMIPCRIVRLAFSGIISMRRIIASAALLLAVAPAFAADMAAPPPILRGVLPMVDKGVDFTGFYVGGFAGFNQMEFQGRTAGQALVQEMLRGTVFLNPGNAADIVNYRSVTSNAVSYGIYGGYNWGVDDYIVGLEADYTRTNLTGSLIGGRTGLFSVPDAQVYPNDQYSYVTSTDSRLKITDYGSLRARFGMPFGSLMPFLSGGIAVARASYDNNALVNWQVRTFTQNVNTGVVSASGWVNGNPYSLTDASRTRVTFGYALGAGIDWAITSNIVARAEVLTHRFGNVGSMTASINTARVGAAVKF
jgi:outer membrane immunogenic protein